MDELRKIFYHCTDDDFERFTNKIKIPTNNKKIKMDECWDWAACKSMGYGKFAFNEQMSQASRIAYLFHYGKLPNECCCNTCNNKLCVNPKHLFEANWKQVVKNTTKHGNNIKADKTFCTSKLSRKMIIDIFKMKFKLISIVKIHKKYKDICSYHTIFNVISYRTHKVLFESFAKQHELSINELKLIFSKRELKNKK